MERHWWNGCWEVNQPCPIKSPSETVNSKKQHGGKHKLNKESSPREQEKFTGNEREFGTGRNRSQRAILPRRKQNAQNRNDDHERTQGNFPHVDWKQKVLWEAMWWNGHVLMRKKWSTIPWRRNCPQIGWNQAPHSMLSIGDLIQFQSPVWSNCEISPMISTWGLKTLKLKVLDNTADRAAKLPFEPRPNQEQHRHLWWSRFRKWKERTACQKLEEEVEFSYNPVAVDLNLQWPWKPNTPSPDKGIGTLSSPLSTEWLSTHRSPKPGFR